MGGAISGSRIALIAIVLAVLLTAGFHWFYPDVAITPGLELEFVLVALLCALAVVGLLRVIASGRRPPTPTPAPPADETKKPA